MLQQTREVESGLVIVGHIQLRKSPTSMMMVARVAWRFSVRVGASIAELLGRQCEDKMRCVSVF